MGVAAGAPSNVLLDVNFGDPERYKPETTRSRRGEMWEMCERH